MSNCKYCNKEEDKQSSSCLSCKQCHELVHLDCLRSKTPGGFVADIFFIFTCAECSASKEEIFERGKISWFHCLVIALYDLKTKYNLISNQGYFHWRTHIGTFISKNWSFLFHPQFKMKKNWAGTFSGVLSQYSPMFFKSGTDDLNQSGWWKLSHSFSPALIKYISSELLSLKQSDKNLKNEYSQTNKELEYSMFLQLVNKLGLSHLLVTENTLAINSNVTSEALKMKTDASSSHSESLDDVDDNNYLYKNEFQPSGMDNYLSNYFPDGEESMSDFDSLPPDFEESTESSNISYLHKQKNNYPDDTTTNYLSSGENCDSDYTSHSNNYHQSIKSEDYSDESSDSRFDSCERPKKKMRITHSSNSNIPCVKSLFSRDSADKSPDLPWLSDYKSLQDTERNQSLVTVSEYEEIQMLNKLNHICRKEQYNVDKKLIRLRAKLTLRKLKRSKHIQPEWNIDSLVCRLAKFPVQDYIKLCSQQSIRVLDRYQQITESLSGTTISTDVNFATRLTGTSELTPFLSPHSGRLLKPFIRRDFNVVSPWIKLMNELLEKFDKKKSTASIDYCYVRPQFIPSINSLCEQYFWPGIDLTETLQYPDFSCVVLYKKLIVGFAFLVPDVGHNEAYVSFIFTRPQWRRSGIAKFMLYHLIQTSIHKDITLHVSATNPAILLYQKFGFKIEELIQDFYDKYFAAESTECKHALFLRLSR